MRNTFEPCNVQSVLYYQNWWLALNERVSTQRGTSTHYGEGVLFINPITAKFVQIEQQRNPISIRKLASLTLQDWFFKNRDGCYHFFKIILWMLRYQWICSYFPRPDSSRYLYICMILLPSIFMPACICCFVWRCCIDIIVSVGFCKMTRT